MARERLAARVTVTIEEPGEPTLTFSGSWPEVERRISSWWEERFTEGEIVGDMIAGILARHEGCKSSPIYGRDYQAVAPSDEAMEKLADFMENIPDLRR